jgi:hypothetical protein
MIRTHDIQFLVELRVAYACLHQQQQYLNIHV